MDHVDRCAAKVGSWSVSGNVSVGESTGAVDEGKVAVWDHRTNRRKVNKNILVAYASLNSMVAISYINGLKESMRSMCTRLQRALLHVKNDSDRLGA